MTRNSEQDRFDELCFYTLQHGDARFIHQHVVDAYAAQTADANTKPITVVFALVGLYLHLERGCTGREVQRAHMKMAKRRKQWPPLPLPEGRGKVTVADVVAVPPGPERDRAIDRWCASVWEAWSASHGTARAVAEAAMVPANRVPGRGR